MAISTDQAVQQVRALRKQGVNWRAIEDHLRASGYVSERTGKPIKELAIRYMIDRADRQDRQEIKEERQEERLYVMASDQSFKDNVNALMSIQGFSPEIRLKLLQVLIENSYNDRILAPSSVVSPSRAEKHL